MKGTIRVFHASRKRACVYSFFILAAIGEGAGVGAQDKGTLEVQIKMEALFSGIPREQIRPARGRQVEKGSGGVLSLREFDYVACLAAELKQAFTNLHAFQDVAVIPPEVKLRPETRHLVIEISKWGFRYSPADPNKGENRKGQLEHLVRYTFTRPEGRISKRELFLSGKERSLQEYRDDEALLLRELKKSIHDYAGLLANKVLYSK